MASVQFLAPVLIRIHSPSLVIMLHINDTLLTLIFSRIYLYLVTNQYKSEKTSINIVMICDKRMPNVDIARVRAIILHSTGIVRLWLLC